MDTLHTLIYHGSGQRIDTWLTSQFSYSRNFFQHIIERGGIRVVPDIANNGMALVQKVKKSYKLQEGDTIYIEQLERFLDGGILAECPPIKITQKVDLEETAHYLAILLEKKDYMVIYKAKGILSHPNSVWDVANPSVVGWLYHYFKAQETQNNLPSTEHFMRAGLVHRLDKDTDGLMIIAKTERWLEYFKGLFQQKSWAETIEEKELVPLKKYYRALCEVSEAGKNFIAQIQHNLPYTIQEDVIPQTPHPIIKEGITKILAMRYGHDYMLWTNWQSLDITSNPSTSSGWHVRIDLEILTWRTHQIRYHLSKYGLPIVGDYLYGKEEDIPMQLTAWKLLFKDINGEEMVISVDV